MNTKPLEHTVQSMGAAMYRDALGYAKTLGDVEIVGGDELIVTPRTSGTCSNDCAQFTTDIDAAMGVEPEAAWPLIAHIWDAHGWNAVYDVGVIAILMGGVGWMYLSEVSAYKA